MECEKYWEFSIENKDCSFKYEFTGFWIDYNQINNRNNRKRRFDKVLNELCGQGQVYSGYDGRIRIKLPKDDAKIEKVLSLLKKEQLTFELVYKSNFDSRNIECIGTKSLVLVTSRVVTEVEILENLNFSPKIAMIHPKFYHLKYDNDETTCSDYKYLKELNDIEWIRCVEPNIIWNDFEDIPTRRSDYELLNLKSSKKNFSSVENINKKAFNLVHFNESVRNSALKEVKVAVLDTHIDLKHEAFQALNIISDDQSLEFEQIFELHNQSSHGTSCTSLVSGYEKYARGSRFFVGFANGVQIIHLPMILGNVNGDSISSLVSILRALHLASSEYKVDVISCSWWFHYSEVLEKMIKEISEIGIEGKTIPLVFAAGNSENKILFPGNMPEVITVGATDLEGNYLTKDRRKELGISWYSSQGCEIDIAAPGHDLICPAAFGSTPDFNSNDDYWHFNGTSSATPIVTSAISHLISKNKNLKAVEIKQKIKTCTYQPTTWSKEWGEGVICFSKIFLNK